MKEIAVAKKELYAKLRKFSEVVGITIGKDTIVVYLSKITKNILSQIPNEFEGYKVVIELKGTIKIRPV